MFVIAAQSNGGKMHPEGVGGLILKPLALSIRLALGQTVRVRRGMSENRPKNHKYTYTCLRLATGAALARVVSYGVVRFSGAAESWGGATSG